MVNDTQHNTDTLKIALYARVSSTTQTNDNQTHRLIEFAKAKGWVVELFEEIMSTRKTRPVKQAMMAKMRAGEFDGVCVFKLDRFARSSTELILDVAELIGKGKIFISISDNLDFSTAVGKLHFQILSAFAEFERALISERTKEGLHRAKMQGKLLGRPKGKRDSKKRKSSGYVLREAVKRKKHDEQKGIHREIHNYLPDTLSSK